MKEAQFDTSILVDALNGVQAAQLELKRVDHRWISRFTWLEILSGCAPEAATRTEAFLDYFSVSELSDEVARRAAAIRSQQPRMKLANAIVWASAQVSGRILVTRNTTDFPAAMPGIRIPYKL